MRLSKSILLVLLLVQLSTGCTSKTVGDIGPGGGIIFYDKGSYSDGWRYLEAAPEDIESFAFGFSWGCTDYYIPGTSSELGTGKINTVRINYHCDNTSAAKVARSYNNADLNDWYLPSKMELLEIYKHREIIKNLNTSHAYSLYWSSTQSCESSAWGIAFYKGHEVELYKNFQGNIRPVRAF
ncbi:MAG: DUF1566 domain-containing protein [Cyclonatronaceae bacterium]